MEEHYTGKSQGLEIIVRISQSIQKLSEKKGLVWGCRLWFLLSIPGIFIAGWAFRNDNISWIRAGAFFFAFWGAAFYMLASNLITYYFTGVQAGNYVKFMQRELKTDKDKKTAMQLRRNRTGSIKLYVLSIGFMMAAILPVFHPWCWLYVENFLFTIPAAMIAFFFVASLGITLGMVVGWRGTYIRDLTISESIYHFGVDRIFIFLGLITGIWVIYKGVVFSMGNQLFASILFRGI